MSWLFLSGGQSIGGSASASVLIMNILGWFFRIDWFDLLAVQGTPKSLLKHHNSKASIHQCSAFFMVQLSHPSMTPGKTLTSTIWIFVSKLMSLLFNTLSGFVIAYIPRSKHLLISWLQSLSAVILEPKNIKSATFSPFMASLVAQTVKNLPAMQEMWVRSLGWEDAVEKRMAVYSSILAWRIPMDREAWRATVHGVAKNRTWLSYWQHNICHEIMAIYYKHVFRSTHILPQHGF